MVFGGEGEGGGEGGDADAVGGPAYTLLGDLWALNLTLAFEDDQSGEVCPFF